MSGWLKMPVDSAPRPLNGLYACSSCFLLSHQTIYGATDWASWPLSSGHLAISQAPSRASGPDMNSSRAGGGERGERKKITKATHDSSAWRRVTFTPANFGWCCKQPTKLLRERFQVSNVCYVNWSCSFPAGLCHAIIFFEQIDLRANIHHLDEDLAAQPPFKPRFSWNPSPS